MKIGRLTAASVSIASMLALTACSTVGGTTGDSSSSNTGSAAGDSSKTMVTVVKVKGIAWFDRMDVGVKEWGAENGYDTRTEGGTDVSPEKQIQIIQDLIAQKPVAITVVPNSPEALSAVLEQARAQGIKVVSHEATGIKNVDVDIEAFDNASYGVDIMKSIGECTGGTGKYVQFVGGLTAKTHMEWVEAAYDYQQRNFPGMERVETPIESTDNETHQRQARHLDRTAATSNTLSLPVLHCSMCCLPWLRPTISTCRSLWCRPTAQRCSSVSWTDKRCRRSARSNPIRQRFSRQSCAARPTLGIATAL